MSAMAGFRRSGPEMPRNSWSEMGNQWETSGEYRALPLGGAEEPKVVPGPVKGQVRHRLPGV